MKHMTRSYPPENAMLREHKESTLEKQQKKRQEHNPPLELDDSILLNKKANERMKRKEALSKAMNKYHDPDIVG
jgi:hypothetical protein